MEIVKEIPHMVQRGAGYYFQAKAAMKRAGIMSEALGKDPDRAAERALQLNAEWNFARGIAGPAEPRHVTFKQLIRIYQNHTWYKVLAPKTKGEVDPSLRVIEDALGALPVKGLRRRHVRQLHGRVMDEKSPHAANKIIKWLCRLLSLAIEEEIRTDNPAENLRLPKTKGRKITWEPAHITAFAEHAIAKGRHGWAAAVMIAYDTAQRRGDILDLTWADYDGEGITVCQNKTDKDLWVPLFPETRAFLETLRTRDGVTMHPSAPICASQRGGKIEANSYFGKVFRPLAQAVGIPDSVQFRDLRRTVATEILAGGGRSEPVTGHEPGSPVLRDYEQLTKEAARASQKVRNRE